MSKKSKIQPSIETPKKSQEVPIAQVASGLSLPFGFLLYKHEMPSPKSTQSRRLIERVSIMGTRACVVFNMPRHLQLVWDNVHSLAVTNHHLPIKDEHKKAQLVNETTEIDTKCVDDHCLFSNGTYSCVVSFVLSKDIFKFWKSCSQDHFTHHDVIQIYRRK